MTGPQTLTTKEADSILQVFEADIDVRGREVIGSRNLLMFLLMLDAGLRVSEVTGLFIEDLWLRGEPMHSLKVRAEIAKGGSERIIPLSNRIKIAINLIHKHRWSMLPTPTSGFAFYSQLSLGHLTDRQAERIIGQAANKAIGRWVNPHILRHTFATNLSRTCSIRVVQELLGHKHLASTQIYTHPNEQDKTDAINSLPKGGD